jgi:LPS-assembly lipoprotein
MRRAALPGATLLGAALLGGCGFHLQGREPLPAIFARTGIETEDAQSEFVQSVRKSLTAGGATLTATPASASAVIHVLEDRLDERVVSVSSRNIPQQYELVYRVRFSVSAADKELLPSEEVSATRDFSFDETQVQAKGREKDILRDALARDVAALVMRRLSSL